MKKKHSILFIIIILAVLLIAMFPFVKKIKNKLVAKDEWRVTQYGQRETNLTFYTLYNPTKGLIVVDGGWTEDADYVREVIKVFGNTVDAWILTHPHFDHVGAFNEIYADPQGMKIKEIYTVPLPSPEDCLKRAKWDNVTDYEIFENLHIPDLQYVKNGDQLSILDLSFEILSTYNDEMAFFSKDYLNDGSMMFRVKNKEKTMLFCADVGVNMSDYLISKYGESLKSDYLEMAHHGNGGLNPAFYTLVHPSVAFFDAPDWLMNDTTGKYTTPANIELMKGMDAEILSFETAPNSFILE